MCTIHVPGEPGNEARFNFMLNSMASSYRISGICLDLQLSKSGTVSLHSRLGSVSIAFSHYRLLSSFYALRAWEVEPMLC